MLELEQEKEFSPHAVSKFFASHTERSSLTP